MSTYIYNDSTAHTHPVIATVDAPDITDRDTAIAEIKKALKQRTGRSWSVTGGRGTSWGWIKISALPKDCRWEHVALATKGPEGQEWEERETAGKYGHMGPADRKVLAEALGLDRVDCSGVSIPAGSDYRREYVQRARGEKPTVIGQPYWD